MVGTLLATASPAPADVVVTVEAGDSLSEIAAEHERRANDRVKVALELLLTVVSEIPMK